MKSKNKAKWILMIIIACMTVISCTTKTVYHHYRSINDDKWNRTDTVFFTLPDSIENGTYFTHIGIRHTVSYPYRDLWLSVSLPGKTEPDTVQLYLANDRGNWNSNGTASGYYQYETDGPSFIYNEGCDSVIKVSHIMKGFTLPAITDIGLKITRE